MVAKQIVVYITIMPLRNIYIYIYIYTNRNIVCLCSGVNYNGGEIHECLRWYLFIAQIKQNKVIMNVFKF